MKTVDWASLPLGLISDREISLQLAEQGIQVDRSTVSRYRVKFGIKASRKASRPQKFDKVDWDSLPLGKISDEKVCLQLAEQGIQVDRSTITRQRRRRNILAAKRVIDWDTFPFSQVSDRVLARSLKCNPSTVAHARCARGLKFRPSSTYDVNWDCLPLGQIPDTILAQHLGITHPTIITRRRERGLPPANRTVDNKILCLVFHHPGHPTSYYADRVPSLVGSTWHEHLSHTESILRRFENVSLVNSYGDDWSPELLQRPQRARVPLVVSAEDTQTAP